MRRVRRVSLGVTIKTSIEKQKITLFSAGDWRFMFETSKADFVDYNYFSHWADFVKKIGFTLYRILLYTACTCKYVQCMTLYNAVMLIRGNRNETNQVTGILGW